jgi:MYXO-CTERM domain-containing protein
MAALAMLAAWEARAGADTVIYNTTPEWDGTTAIAAWGSVQSGFTATVGQTFVAPANVLTLDSFSFHITDFTPGDTLSFQADVYAWSGSLLGGNPPQAATGPALFTSPDMVFVDTGGFQTVTIDTAGTTLTPGAAYIALLTTSDPGSIAANGSSLGLYELGLTGFFVHQPNNGGGGFNFYNNTSSSQLNTTLWDDFADNGDLAWTAIFTTVPEPGGVTLLGLGLLLVGLIGRLRRRTDRAP